MAKVNLQELAYASGLTNLQIVGLNEIGSQIEDGMETYLSVADSLSEAENNYLRAWLGNEGIELPPKDGE